MLKAFVVIVLCGVEQTKSFNIGSNSKWSLVKSSTQQIQIESQHFIAHGKKIEDEESELNIEVTKSKNKRKNRKEEIKNSSNVITSNAQTGEITSSISLEELAVQNTNENIPEHSSPISTISSSSSIRSKEKRVQQEQQGQIPPEIVFFGDSRRPPPIEAGQDARYHGSLLLWARHGTVIPVDSVDRRSLVLPFACSAIRNSKYRLKESELSYETIFNGFVSVMNDLEESKAFISTNIDIVPSVLFMRALTAQKLRKQYEKDLTQMDYLKQVRQRYILAHDQLFFPLNIEVRKAETRVMTYLSRLEFPEFAKGWDEVETSLHFLTLISARITWDIKVKELLDRIKSKITETVDYMAEAVRKDLMTREFRRPGITSEVYTNATIEIAQSFPEIYRKVSPEIRIIHETYEMTEVEQIRTYATEFCIKNSINLELFKLRLRILSASMAGIQGTDYSRARLQVDRIHSVLCDKNELANMNKWYIDKFKSGYGFSTYEPDRIPSIVNEELKYRDTGNAFLNFGVEVMKMNPVATTAFAGGRPKASVAESWLERDADYNADVPASYNEKLDSFKIAYSTQMMARNDAQNLLNNYVDDRVNKSLSILPPVVE